MERTMLVLILILFQSASMWGEPIKKIYFVTMAQYIEDIFFCTLDVIKKAKIAVNVESQNYLIWMSSTERKFK